MFGRFASVRTGTLLQDLLSEWEMPQHGDVSVIKLPDWPMHEGNDLFLRYAACETWFMAVDALGDFCVVASPGLGTRHSMVLALSMLLKTKPAAPIIMATDGGYYCFHGDTVWVTPDLSGADALADPSLVVLSEVGYLPIKTGRIIYTAKKPPPKGCDYVVLGPWSLCEILTVVKCPPADVASAAMLNGGHLRSYFKWQYPPTRVRVRGGVDYASPDQLLKAIRKDPEQWLRRAGKFERPSVTMALEILRDHVAPHLVGKKATVFLEDHNPYSTVVPEGADPATCEPVPWFHPTWRPARGETYQVRLSPEDLVKIYAAS